MDETPTTRSNPSRKETGRVLGFFDVEAGVFVRRHLRHLLRGEESPDMKWFETKGWLGSTFHVEAEQTHARNIHERIQHWRKAMNQ